MSGGNLAGDRQSSIDHQLFDLLKAMVAAVRELAVSEGSGHVQSGSVTGHAYALLVCDPVAIAPVAVNSYETPRCRFMPPPGAAHVALL